MEDWQDKVWGRTRIIVKQVEIDLNGEEKRQAA
jgi:hypothetical protein